MYDRVAMGTSEDAENEDFDETAQSLLEYDDEWYVGMENDSEWTTAVERGKASLFTVNFNAIKVITFIIEYLFSPTVPCCLCENFFQMLLVTEFLCDERNSQIV